MLLFGWGERVHLGQGDVSVLSSGVFHRGLVQAEARRVLFFYLDRTGEVSMSSGRTDVGERWDDVGDRGGYCVEVCFGAGLRGVTQGLERGWAVKDVRAGGRRKRRSSVPCLVN